MTDRRTFIISGIILALIIAVAAPFLASENPDGLESAFYGMYGAKAVTGSDLNEEQAELAEDAVIEKTGNDYSFGAPMPDYTIPGLDKPGEVIAIVTGTLIMVGLAWGVGMAVSRRHE
ncbi:MAG: PDGLE domain-containing protein [Methanoculleaceae archaeon]